MFRGQSQTTWEPRSPELPAPGSALLSTRQSFIHQDVCFIASCSVGRSRDNAAVASSRVSSTAGRRWAGRDRSHGRRGGAQLCLSQSPLVGTCWEGETPECSRPGPSAPLCEGRGLRVEINPPLSAGGVGGAGQRADAAVPAGVVPERRGTHATFQPLLRQPPPSRSPRQRCGNRLLSISDPK